MTEKRRKDDCRETNVTFSLDTGHVKIYIKYVYIVSSSVHSLVSPSPSEFIIVAIIISLIGKLLLNWHCAEDLLCIVSLIPDHYKEIKPVNQRKLTLNIHW